MRTAWTIAAIGMLAAGCGGDSDGLPREPISGKVTLDGQPLKSGMITFTPTSAPEPIVSCLIKDGTFDLPRVEGPIPGAHRVSIWAKESTGKQVKSPDDPEKLVDEVRDLIPRRYNFNSELAAEVKARDANSYEFALSGAKVATEGRSRRSRR